MDVRIIEKKLEELNARSITRSQPISSYRARAADYLSPGEYRYDSEWLSVSGQSGWAAGKTVFLVVELDVPPEWPDQGLYVVFNMADMEGMASLDGKPHHGIDANHRRIALPQKGRYRFDCELVAVSRAWSHPELRSHRALIKEMSVVHVARTTESLWLDLRYAWNATKAMADERRKQRVTHVLENALFALDLTLTEERFQRAVAESQQIYNQGLGAIQVDPEEGRIYLAGHTHIDTAWLWTLDETIRKCGRTFSTAVRLMQKYKSFHFSCSQAQLYEFTRDHYPSLYEEIRSLVKEGRWETTGAMWVEPDCNIPSGESLIRQILYGIDFFTKELGTRPRSCWLPDCFGFPATLPQILSGCGLNAFYTNKIHWHARNRFPHNLFWWEGTDRSRILAHIPELLDFYTGDPLPERLIYAQGHFSQKGVYDELLFPYGYGDGGGGPTEEMVEFAERSQSFPGVPASRQGGEEGYFSRVVSTDPDLPTWRGELYLENHRGTLTSQAHVKKHNRIVEVLLRSAEILSTVAASLEGSMGDPQELAETWKELLLLQFHDILPGSSIGAVYAKAEAAYEKMTESLVAMNATKLESIADREHAGEIAVFNTLSWERDGLARFRLARGTVPGSLVGFDGEVTPIQRAQASEAADSSPPTEEEYVFVAGRVPSIGLASYEVSSRASSARGSLSVLAGRMENQFFTLHLNERGEITRLLDKRCGREVIPDGEAGNRWQLFQDGPEEESAWNVHSTFEQCEYEFEGESTCTVLAEGPVYGALRISRSHRESRFVQDIVIYDRIPRIDFVTTAEWRERQVLLKVAFPVTVLSESATCEIQFGTVQRPTHRNTSWDQEKFEVAAHRWIDLSEADYGVSLLNDCKYGHDVKNNVLRLSLLRGTEYPDPEADRGTHRFVYSLYPHLGDWREGRTTQEAAALNNPLLVSVDPRRTGKSASRSYFSVSGGAILETVKPAMRTQEWILRVYEPLGGRGRVTVTAAWPLRKVAECNHVEEGSGEVTFSGRAFTFQLLPNQIRTFRVQLHQERS